MTKDFSINIDLHKGSSLSPYIFTLVLDILIGYIQKSVLKYILFTNDIILIKESRNDVNYKLKIWRKVLESKYFCLSKNKTEHMKCKFSKRQTHTNFEVKIREHIISIKVSIS